MTRLTPGIKPHDGTRGVTLLELVIAVFVLSIGTIAALRSADQAGRVLGGEAARVMAMQVALNRAEELRLLGAVGARSLSNRVVYGPYNWQVAVSEEATRAGFTEATITARSPDQPGGRVVVIAPTEVVAEVVK
ncbi:general secretion pathway protein I [Roseovarius marisflavi]|uniref:General secretion pathway protein I n=1 Tax=Roseovarius marisflavi TaxID=1054996 RepID=A0A1M6YPN4_9RHOB|nr:prepilin-type N-terminal cleavage/methylation domain-containing protein [Roseovarius marisflavi]SHL20216.1 general secretion pathway protein I [Roseovarius marisflavi]